MKKRIWQTLLCFLIGSWMLQAQTSTPKITMKTKLAFGETLRLNVKTLSEDPFTVDWGDGKPKEYKIRPDAWAFERNISGAVAGGDIVISGALAELDCTEGKIESFVCENHTKLTLLNLSGNELTKESLDLSGCPNLTNLDLSRNKITALNLSSMSKLVYFSINDNEQLGTVIFPDGSENLVQISMNNGDVSHFYPISLPKLTSLKLNGNALFDIEIAAHYPSLTELEVEDNSITVLDVSKCSKLSKLNVNKNQLSVLNVSSNTGMLNLFCAENNLEVLNLNKNTSITSLNCSKNKIKELDVRMLTKLTDLNCSGNLIAELILDNNIFLKFLRASDCQLSSLNLGKNNRLRHIDLKNNARMTACALNAMFDTMWPCDQTNVYSANLLLAGSNAETADGRRVTSEEYKWKCDVAMDATAVCGEATVEVKQTKGGILTVEYFDPKKNDYTQLPEKVKIGTQLRLTAQPENENYTFGGIKVNDKLQEKRMTMVLMENAVIEPVWLQEMSITLQTTKGHDLSFSLIPGKNRNITIDWGDGTATPYEIEKEIQRFDHKALGSTVVIRGEIINADFSSYPGMGTWDNEFTGVTITPNNSLEVLSLYMNPIKNLDVSESSALRELDCAFTELSSLNVAKNSKLEKLLAYGNNLTELDVRNNQMLVTLEARNNKLTKIDLSKNTRLNKLDLQNNQIAAINVAAPTQLQQLFLDGNMLTELNLAPNTELTQLSIANNKLKKIDLKEQSNLLRLNCANNFLETLDLSHSVRLGYLNCAGNGFSACVLNDIYHSLNEYPELEGFEPADNVLLRVTQENSARPNDAKNADSVLATIKGWKINQTGNGKGCDQAYVIIEKTDFGTLLVKDQNGQEITSGSKVNKPAQITIEAKPDAGYQLQMVRVNGKNIAGNAYKVEEATFITAVFISSIDAVEEAHHLTLEGNLLSLDTEVQRVAVYALDGSLILDSSLASGASFTLPQGVCVVQITTSAGTSNHKLLVP